MRFLVPLLLTLLPVSAQADFGKLLGQGLLQSLGGMIPVPEPEKSEVIKATVDLLTKHITIHPDGTSSSFCIPCNNQQIEWKGFVIKSIQSQTITEADRLNGVTKRDFIGFSCDASRSWDSKKHTWSEWQSVGHVLFPAGARVEYRDGKWLAVETDQFKYFAPGPGPATAPIKKDAGPSDLPPGMTRAK